MKKKMTAMLMVIVLLIGLFPTAVGAVSYYPRYTGKSTSLVTALQAVGVDSSYSNRAKIAKANGMTNYSGKSGENLLLLTQLKGGKLKKPATVTGGPLSSTASSTTSGSYVCKTFEECTSGGICYEVIKDNAPLRAANNNKGKVLANLKQGQLLRVKKIEKNSKGNKWAVVEYINASGKTAKAYMYTGNIRQHTEHTFATLLDSSNGTVQVCMVCGHAVVTSGSKKSTCDLMCVADQAVRGDYADSNTTFWGLVGRVAVGEIPVAGTAADVRDLVYDLTHDPSVFIVGVDLLALLPLIGSMKYLSKMDNLKYADEAATAGKVAVKASKYSFSNDVFKHFMVGSGVKGKAVSGAQITAWAVEALSNAKPVSGTTDMIYGYASNGLKFEAYIDANKTITSFWPTTK